MTGFNPNQPFYGGSNSEPNLDGDDGLLIGPITGLRNITQAMIERAMTGPFLTHPNSTMGKALGADQQVVEPTTGQGQI